ncbi:MAG: cell division protein ZapE [Porticoccaceae bacterium]|nr:cell division protein ZapE [Porticoccaceae bacterium]
MLSPTERYKEDVRLNNLLLDDAQLEAVNCLDELYTKLESSALPSFNAATRFLYWSGFLEREKGLYLWGGVGRGKTFLMDIFFDALPFPNKMRTHFYRFMQLVHDELKLCDGSPNPIDIVASRLAKKVKVICLDEFFVADITDAMILSLLLDALFSKNICMVFTSNICPDDLYLDGLQRQRFVSAIQLIKLNCNVVNLKGTFDYRRRALMQAPLFYSPLSSSSDLALTNLFSSFLDENCQVLELTTIQIEQREIEAYKLCDKQVWFKFSDLCEGPRSQLDYIEIACLFHTVFVTGVPEMNEIKKDVTRRFIIMVDEFYDQGVKLIMSAEVPIENFNCEGSLSGEFQRTKSRLIEMQSHKYLSRGHRC